MRHNYSCEYGSVLLRPLKDSDIEPLRLLRNSQREYFFNSNVISAEEQIKWFVNYLDKNDDIMCAVELRSKPGNFIGAMALYDINIEKKEAEFGRALIDKTLAPESGTGRDAVTSICLIGFKLLKLKKITCATLPSNTRSINVYKKVGFRIIENSRICHMELNECELKTDNSKIHRI